MNLHARWIGMVFAAGITVLAVTAAASALPYRPEPGRSVVSGEATRQFESHYDEQFPVKTLGTNVWGAIQYLLFGEGRSGVIVGREGWLYTQEEFREYSDAEQQIAAHLSLIERAQAELQQRGTELVVAVVPSKARLYPEYVEDAVPAAVHRDLYARLHAELRQRDITAPDLLDALARCKARNAVFLRTDTHWTPEGADCGANAIAAELAPVTAAQTFETEVLAPRPHAGDLMQFLPLAPTFSALLPPPDLLVPRSTLGTADLLGEAPAPQVVLVGTSYSADRNWDFDGALRKAMATDVLNLAESGRGPFEPMLDFLALPLAEASPRRVIWEIPERYLPAGEPLNDPDRVQLALASP